MVASVVDQAKRNIRYYPLVKMFNKRVFLAIIPIYYVHYIGFSLQAVGLLAALYALINMLANLPTGYIADRVGKARMVRIAAVMQIIATLMYAGVANKVGVVIGSVFEALAFSVLAGAAEALLHDSLEVTKQADKYSKVVGRSQSIALVMNALFVGLVSLTYAIDPRVPYLFGTIAFTILLFAGLRMKDVLPPAKSYEKTRFDFSKLSVLLQYKKLIVFGVLFGIVGAVYFSFDIMPLAMQSFGLNPEYIGTVYAVSSLVGAVFGLGVHRLKKLRLEQYALLDVAILATPFAAGFTGNLWLLVAAVIGNIAFWRFRYIIYQDHLLTLYKVRYKATMLSTMQVAEGVNRLWVPVVVMSVVSAFGMQTGLGMIALGCVVLGVAFVTVAQRIDVTRS